MPVSSAYPPEFPLDELRTPENLLIVTLRLWLTAPAAPLPGQPCWWEGLWRATGEFRAADSFQQFLGLLLVETKRPLDWRCPCSETLGEDEGLLLQLMALYQNRRAEAACALLSGWLPPAACRIAAAPAADVARRLARRGLLVPWRAPLCTRLSRLTHADPGLALVQ